MAASVHLALSCNKTKNAVFDPKVLVVFYLKRLSSSPGFTVNGTIKQATTRGSFNGWKRCALSSTSHSCITNMYILVAIEKLKSLIT